MVCSRLRRPTASDAAAIRRLIEDCPPLDVNSTYAYLLLCHHFRDTCVVAEDDRGLVGFLSGYLPPTSSDTLFVWQVAVAQSARSQGLASVMIDEVLARTCCANVRFLEATVSPSNHASRRLFRGIASRRGTDCRESDFFPQDLFPGEESHEAENLLRIGPLSRERRDARSAIPNTNGPTCHRHSNDSNPTSAATAGISPASSNERRER